MLQTPHALSETKPLQHRPARWIQTIAANFFAGKFFTLEYQGFQTDHCAKRGAARSGWPAADNCNVKKLHGVN
jgi:hypothetical protein